jgi:hypothetical protein
MAEALGTVDMHGRGHSTAVTQSCVMGSAATILKYVMFLLMLHVPSSRYVLCLEKCCILCSFGFRDLTTSRELEIALLGYPKKGSTQFIKRSIE